MPVYSDISDLATAEHELDRYEKRIRIAEIYGDSLAVARLALAASHLAIRFHLIRRAASFDDLAISVFTELPAPFMSRERATLVKGLQKGGMNQLLLGNTTLASARLEKAQRLVDDAVSPLVRANVHWDSSVLEQWRHQPLAGLAHALRAWEYYGESGPASERLRLRIQIAQLAMDVAEIFLTQCAYSLFDAYLQVAEHHLQRAYLRYHSWFAPDAPAALATAHIRYSRLANRNEDRMSIIEYTLYLTGRTRDTAGHGLALTALAEALAAFGGPEAARPVYIEAYETFQRSPAPGMAYAAKRKLLLDEEFRPSEHITLE